MQPEVKKRSWFSGKFYFPKTSFFYLKEKDSTLPPSLKNPVMVFAKNVFSGARHLLFPRLCCGCQRPMLPEEKLVCFICFRQLSQTNYHHVALNETALRITGRFPLEKATSFCYFAHGGLMQHLLHQIKYKRRADLAFELGEAFGTALAAAGFLEGIDAVVPVPLHFRKEWKRGYNQSERIAAGMEKATHIPVETRLLRRVRHTESQTSMTAAERQANVKDAFEVRKRSGKPPRHFLLLDDVLTTGATLEACAKAILESIPGSRISIATAAVASR